MNLVAGECKQYLKFSTVTVKKSNFYMCKLKFTEEINGLNEEMLQNSFEMLTTELDSQIH